MANLQQQLSKSSLGAVQVSVHSAFLNELWGWIYNVQRIMDSTRSKRGPVEWPLPLNRRLCASRFTEYLNSHPGRVNNHEA